MSDRIRTAALKHFGVRTTLQMTSSKSDYLPKTLTPIPSHWGLGFQYMGWVAIYSM